MSVPRPNPPRLWGSNPTELEESRGVTNLRLTWDRVAGASGYDLRIDGGTIMPVQPDVTPGGFGPNTLHSFEVRAKVGTDVSLWSGAFETVTRPPTPTLPKQDAASVSIWGVALLWNESASLPGAYIDVWRRLGGVENRLNEGQPLPLLGGWLDETDPSMSDKAFWLQLVVPALSVPGDRLPGDNVSFFGPEIQLSGPVVRRAVIPPRSVRSSDQLWHRQYGRAGRLL